MDENRSPFPRLLFRKGMRAIKQAKESWFRRRQVRHFSRFGADKSCHVEAPFVDPPKISVITPSFNQGRFLEVCIRSVLEQDYPSLEYIINDGGSRDNSLETIRKYQSKITYWRSHPDAGQCAAINEGFKKSTGDLVAWLNADDFYLPGALEAVGRSFLANPNASFYFGNGWRVDETGAPKSAFFVDNRVAFSREGMIYGLNHILQPASFINKSMLVKAGLLDENLHYGMDTDLWIRLSAIAPPEPIPLLLAASREYGHTKTSTGSFKRIEELREIAYKYSGLPMTPGVLCYFLDTLLRTTREREDIFTSGFDRALRAFWGETARLMTKFGCKADGFPLCHKTDSNESE